MDKGGEAYGKRKIMAICLDEWWDEGIFELSVAVANNNKIINKPIKHKNKEWH